MKFGGKVDTVDAAGDPLTVALEEGVITLERVEGDYGPRIEVLLSDLDAALARLR